MFTALVKLFNDASGKTEFQSWDTTFSDPHCNSEGNMGRKQNSVSWMYWWRDLFLEKAAPFNSAWNNKSTVKVWGYFSFLLFSRPMMPQCLFTADSHPPDLIDRLEHLSMFVYQHILITNHLVMWSYPSPDPLCFSLATQHPVLYFLFHDCLSSFSSSFLSQFEPSTTQTFEFRPFTHLPLFSLLKV